ncbi:MAG: hypothetical protein IKF60_01785 [Solobacterium sp.]|nr:hypothetical protein [Solobacterium sp.]
MANTQNDSSFRSGSEYGREALRKRIPEPAITALEHAQNQEELHAILEQYSIDPAALAQEFSNAEHRSIPTVIPDNGLSSISGGFEENGHWMGCICGATDRNDFTYQALATAVSNDRVYEVYSCDRCGRILQFNKNHSCNVYTIQDYPHLLFLNRTYMPDHPATVAIPK